LLVGRTVQIGPAFYNNVLMPVGVFLLAATAVVPLIRWGTAPRRSEQVALLICGLLACGAAGVAAGLGAIHPLAIAVAGLTTLAVSSVAAGVLLDIRRHNVGNLLLGTWRALRANRREYGGYIVHLAFACVVIGVAGSSLGTRRQDVDLDEGEAIEWAGRRVEAVRLVQREDGDKLVAELELRVSRAGSPPVLLKPARQFHVLQNQWTTEVAIDSTWAGDFYTILHAGLGGGRVAITLVENPMIRWIWVGGWLAAVGAAVAVWPARRKSSKRGGRLRDDQPFRADVPVRRRRAA
jgi:cytochrome c-type biogenesis protein CcmF